MLYNSWTVSMIHKGRYSILWASLTVFNSSSIHFVTFTEGRANWYSTSTLPCERLFSCTIISHFRSHDNDCAYFCTPIILPFGPLAGENGKLTYKVCASKGIALIDWGWEKGLGFSLIHHLFLLISSKAKLQYAAMTSCIHYCISTRLCWADLFMV